jgi:hypothetical protein
MHMCATQQCCSLVLSTFIVTRFSGTCLAMELRSLWDICSPKEWWRQPSYWLSHGWIASSNKPCKMHSSQMLHTCKFEFAWIAPYQVAKIYSHGPWSRFPIDTSVFMRLVQAYATPIRQVTTLHLVALPVLCMQYLLFASAICLLRTMHAHGTELRVCCNA